eukprot:TRINITY_DN1321_c0_g2_i1.p1 TRINITY_DN1321_c0_g2~~TRINITY_DN1321_c0_g2_i1.p1  ORF type:complete len:176 (-),score=64.83 TRINITY_DN1321_c0_g2_i1:109-636(-)
MFCCAVSQEKLDEALKSFAKHAVDGKITRQAFKTILAGIMYDELADQVFDSFDRDKNGYMDLDEYLTMMGVTHGGTVQQKLNASFDLFDKNGDGTLSRDEIREMFILIIKQKRVAQGKPVVKGETLEAREMAIIEGVIEAVFKEVDIDHNGVLDRAEYLRGFSEHPEICGFFNQF